MTSNTITLLAVALFSFLAAVILLWVGMRNKAESFPLFIPVCWVFVPMFPVLVIFHFLPSTAEGTLMNIKLGGAFAAYAFLVVMGVRWNRQFLESKQTAELQREKEKTAKLEASLKEADLKSAEATPQRGQILGKAKYLYPLKNKRGKSIGIVTGNISNVNFADIWVSSENTNMEMARHFDKGVSATIRFLGLVENDSFRRSAG